MSSRRSPNSNRLTRLCSRSSLSASWRCVRPACSRMAATHFCKHSPCLEKIVLFMPAFCGRIPVEFKMRAKITWAYETWVASPLAPGYTGRGVRGNRLLRQHCCFGWPAGSRACGLASPNLRSGIPRGLHDRSRGGKAPRSREVPGKRDRQAVAPPITLTSYLR